ncbi:M20/M25/M40 family metallo-hydrolase [Xanthobacter dioxanivorans]|uniref:M20/M25/M40 family metallo-hydrolase n=1 Tax=Xanthobacter dioxanivorans TaxID=2528964 RepID=UPI0019322E2D|nr:M20/M25/M40 family metallo-hydrolase [Xanthobacter dioxanivorans]
MTVTKQDLEAWVDADRDVLIQFVQDFIRCRSPNPPGDTLEAAQHVRAFLDAQNIAYEIIAPNELMPNIVSSFEGGAAGRHLALNGHMDVFPVEDESAWSQDPWGGALVDGKIYGRGSADMKCGTTASIFAYTYLNRIREQLKGRLTLVVVSDEETFGPWGARYLAEHRPEVFGDCCLNGEPSGISTVRFGEKGPLWLEFRIRTAGAHGAYTHMSPSATVIASELIADLARLKDLAVPDLGNLEAAISSASGVIDGEYGAGAAAIIRKVTVNPGLVAGGVKVNLVAAECRVQVDIRVPNGLTEKDILPHIDEISARHHGVTYRVILSEEPAWTPPDSEMIDYVRQNAKQLAGIDPAPIISLGATDARLWRYKGLPAIVYGPAPRGMGSVDEHVPVEEFIHIVKCHVLSAFDYLRKA